MSDLINSHVDLFTDIPRRRESCGDAVPIKQHPYRLSPIKMKHLQNEVKYMLENNIIEPSDSPWSSPCILVPKPDGSFRFCTDYRKSNLARHIAQIRSLMERLCSANLTVNLVKTWVNTANRRNTFKFSDQYLTNTNFKFAIYTAKSKSGINWRDLTNLTVGFLDGWLTDDTCLSMYDDITGFSRSNARHYQTFDALTQAIASGEVDCGFMFYIEPLKTDLQVLTAGGLEDKCSKSSLSIMTRPDNKLTLWWNDAFQRIRDNGVYQKVCDDVTINHGHVITEMTLSRKCLED
ncbi:hypothetical protein BSL78_00983 [Apostichopus japonicus]|uniref:Uncharacterized protein n=1 Tax=Stichopus japonicus TaxID=307972 RepID=A0A2G8LPJ9_STIJA|nr:hypothetical protein BSL78_00983 [Apostichopus japonicus]